MSANKVFDIVEEYNDAAFELCKRELYEILRFRVLQLEDIRRVDLKEKLADFFHEHSYNRGETESVAGFMAGLLQANNSYEEDTRNKNYYLTAVKCAERVRNNEGDVLPTLETLTMIYVSQMRQAARLTRKEKGKKKAVPANTEYRLTTDDTELVRLIMENVEQYSKDLEGVFKGKTTTKKLEHKDRRFIYVWTVLLLARVLQLEGEI